MARILAIANQKGGVGKTTTCINLAASLAAMKKRVMLIDLDPQGNATMGSGVDKYEVERSIYDVLVDDQPVASVLQRAQEAKYDVLPANSDLMLDVWLLKVGQAVTLPDKYELMRRKTEQKYFKGRKLSSVNYLLPGGRFFNKQQEELRRKQGAAHLGSWSVCL